MFQKIKKPKQKNRYGSKSQSVTSKATVHSIGIGTSASARKNAFEVMRNGDAYLIGVDGYDGTNAGATGVLTLQQIINAIT